MKAEFQQIGNNMYWTYYTPSQWNDEGSTIIPGERLQWGGYNDSYWWDNVATQPGHNTRKDKEGNTYQLDYHTNLITLIP